MNTPKTALETGALVADIVDTHHTFLRREIPQIDAEISALLTGSYHPDAHLVRFAVRWRTLAAELLAHQDLEEAELFPAIVAAPRCVSDVGPVAIITRAAYVDKLVHDHRSIEAGLDEVDELLARVSAPQAGDVVERVAQAIADTREHLRKETDVLFPRLVGCLTA